MTVVNHETGELLDDLTRDEAERLSARISTRLDIMADNYAAVMPMIREAISRNAHAALGYRSPGDYARERFGDALSKLDPSMRREVVKELTEVGMSTRAIAPIVGASFKTVARDAARVSGDTPQTPESAHGGEAVTDSGHIAPAGLSAAGSPGSQDGGSPGETPVRAEVVADDLAPRPAITGIDGKTYAKPARGLKPVANEAEWDDQDRAEELASNLARNLSLTYALTNADRRAEYIANWSRGIKDRPVLGHNFVTPKHMRAIADALRTFATEWEQANV